MEKMNNPYESLDLNTRIALAEDINTPNWDTGNFGNW